jgi:hypothetical protein
VVPACADAIEKINDIATKAVAAVNIVEKRNNYHHKMVAKTAAMATGATSMSAGATVIINASLVATNKYKDGDGISMTPATATTSCLLVNDILLDGEKTREGH